MEYIYKKMNKKWAEDLNMCPSLSCAQQCVGCSGLQGDPAGRLWAPHDLAAPRAGCLRLAARGSGESISAEMQERRSNRKQKWCGQLAGGRRLSRCPFPPSSVQRCVYAKVGAFFSPLNYCTVWKDSNQIFIWLNWDVLKKMQLPVE